MTFRRLNQNGAVSFLSVIIFTIIISVIILAYMQSATQQQRNASNYDFSTRAYYAAESGIQDTIRAFKSDTNLRQNGKTDCGPLAPNNAGTIGAGPEYGLSYTCQLVTARPEAITGTIGPDSGTAMIRLDASGSPIQGNPDRYRLIIRWSLPSADGDRIARTNSQPQFEQLNSWNSSNYHALVRMSLIKAPKIGTFSSNDISQRVLFLNPVHPDNGGVGNKPDLLSSNASLETQQAELFHNARCYDSGSIPSTGVSPPPHNGYACVASFTLDNTTGSGNYNLSTNAVYLRLSALYTTTNFSVSLGVQNAPATTYPLANIQGVMDVTGKAGTNVYRRVQQAVALNTGYSIDNEPDAALIGAEGICKYFSLGTTSATFNANPKCNPLTD